jgi:hypothetical protein
MGKKNKKQFFKQSAGFDNLKGFMLTCDSGREKKAIAEVENLIYAVRPIQWVDELCPQSIESAKKPLLKVVDTGCKVTSPQGVIFIKIVRSHPSYEDLDVVALATGLFLEGQRQTRFVSRFVPICGTCQVDNRQQFQKLVEAYLAKYMRPNSAWSFEYKVRNYSSANKQTFTETILNHLPAGCTYSEEADTAVFLHINKVNNTQKMLCFSVLPRVRECHNFSLQKHYTALGV